MVRSPRNNKYSFGICTDIHDTSSFPVTQYLLTYLLNICHSIDVSKNLIDLAFSVLSTDSQEELITFLIPETEDPQINTADIVNDIIYDHRNAGHRIKKLLDQNSRLYEHDLTDIIVSLCTKQRGSTPIERPSRVQELQEVFGLSDEEIDVLSLIYCFNETEEFYDFLRQFNISSFSRVVAAATDVNLQTVKDILSSNSPLLKLGLIKAPRRRGGTDLWLTRDIFDFLSGVNDTSLVEKYCRKDSEECLAIENFTVSCESRDIITGLLGSSAPCNILICGPPGTGKTEFTRSIISECGKTCFFLQYGSTGSNSINIFREYYKT